MSWDGWGSFRQQDKDKSKDPGYAGVTTNSVGRSVRVLGIPGTEAKSVTSMRQPLLSPAESAHPDPETGELQPSGSFPEAAEHAPSGHDRSGSHEGAESAQSHWRKAAGAMTMTSKHKMPPRRLGKPQGIDVKRSTTHHWDYLHHNLNADVRITVIDYDAEGVQVHPQMQNADLAPFLEQPRPEWSSVRWINLQGLSWDCILALALKFDLHPLAVEDCVQVPQRIKVDVHSSNSIFCCLTLASVVLEAPDDAGSAQSRASSSCAPPPAANPEPGPGHQRAGSGSGRGHAHGHAGQGLSSAHSAIYEGGEGVDEGEDGKYEQQGAEQASHRLLAKSSSSLRRLSSARVKGILPPLKTQTCQTPACSDLRDILSAISMSDPSRTGVPYRPLRKRLSRPCVVGGSVSVGSPRPQATPAAAAAAAAASTGSLASAPGQRSVSQPVGTVPGVVATKLPATASAVAASGGGVRGPGRASHAGATKTAAAEAASEGLMTSLEIAAEQVYIFLMRDGTVITMFEKDGSNVCRPVLQQLVDPGSLARESEDASYLLNLLIDAMVDVVFPLVDAYTERLHLYEDRVLLGQRDPAFTRDLHVMRGDLAALRRTMLPTSSLVAALQGHAERHAEHLGDEVLISSLTRTYLGDVQDHLSTILEDMESLQAQCQALSDLVFNLIAHNQNKSMQTLSVISAVFLPITFVAGVYGTNFEFLPEIHWPYGYAYFWASCWCLAIVFMISLWRMGVMSS